MPLLLNIDAATASATVSLADESKIYAQEINNDQKDHASFLQPAVQKLLEETKFSADQIQGISVSAGPGSYTGLRVGLASAKGLCFAWNKPLLLLNTLEILAKQAILQGQTADLLYCPMIDARRMEVFSALYDRDLNPIIEPGAYLLDGPDFVGQLTTQDKDVSYFGSGMKKWKEIAPKTGGNFIEMTGSNAQAQNQLAQRAYLLKRFADVAYSEPLYFKSFYTTAKVIPQN